MYVGFKVILKSKLLTDAVVMGGGGGFDPGAKGFMVAKAGFDSLSFITI